MITRRSLMTILGSAALGACASKEKPAVVRLDYATYNPVGLLLKQKGYLEQGLSEEGVKVEWVKSLGSNKALEFLNSKSVDFGSTAGAAAFVGRANGNPIRAVYVYSKPEWTALVTRPSTGIRALADLKGKRVAVTRGTDPFIFLLRALDSVGLTEKDIELVPLQHPEGQKALERGDVDAWSGLDPMMASSELEHGSTLFFRNPEFNSYGVLNVREELAQRYPALVKAVIAAYERARADALKNPAELQQALAKEAHLTEAVSKAVLARTDISSPSIGERQKTVILAAGDVLKKSGVVKAEVDVPQVAGSLIDSSFTQELSRS
ncbi:MAG: aliphatic sulfonate ABC transporter substrate-binding protein [Myxococcales bacterium]|nr:MAG: aliphatic sulfonate ABC transporter substrate-binding protein [Myxococcales bacterium]